MKCIDEEIPFEIPQGWEWTRMGNIGDWGAGATPAKGNAGYYGGTILWLRTGELNNSVVYDTEIKITEKALKECSLRLNKVGDVMIAMYGATIGKVAIVGRELTTNQACCACTPFGIYNYFLFYFLMGSQADFVKKGEGGAQPNISREKLISHLMPIPPINEQYRIVEKIKTLFPLIDKYNDVQIQQDKLNSEIEDRLRKSILQEAIRGTLVSQKKEEGTAQVLLEQIKEEKQRLVKEGKLKKSALNDSVIFKGDDNRHYEKIGKSVQCIEDEIPFEIPESWAWERWGNISLSIQYGYNAPALEHGVIKMVRISDIQKNKVQWDSVPYCMIEENDIGTYLLKENDILFARTGGTVGKSFLVDNVPERAIYAGYLIRTRYSSMLNPHYMKMFMESQLYWDQLKNGTIATAQPNCNGKTLAKMLLPIPPTNEQDRIVEKLNRLVPVILHYGDCQDKLDLLNAEIKEQLRKSVLQEAIQGRLVPQIEEEGTAQDLLELIKEEKQRLVKEGKLKKSALNDSIIFKGDDNRYYEKMGKTIVDISEQISFDIPETWSWARGKSIFLPMESEKPKNDFVYIDVDAVNNKKYRIDKPKNIKKGNAPSRASRKLHKNDILFSMVRPYLKNIALVTDEYKNAIASTGFYVITPCIGISPQYLYWMMLSSYVVDGLNIFMKGDNSPSINNCHIEDYLYPIPPKAEQQRIVAQIDELFEQLH